CDGVWSKVLLLSKSRASRIPTLDLPEGPCRLQVRPDFYGVDEALSFSFDAGGNVLDPTHGDLDVIDLPAHVSSRDHEERVLQGRVQVMRLLLVVVFVVGGMLVA